MYIWLWYAWVTTFHNTWVHVSYYVFIWIFIFECNCIFEYALSDCAYICYYLLIPNYAYIHMNISVHRHVWSNTIKCISLNRPVCVPVWIHKCVKYQFAQFWFEFVCLYLSLFCLKHMLQNDAYKSLCMPFLVHKHTCVCMCVCASI